MSFGGGSTSDIGDPRSGEATYAGTSSVAGTAEQMGRDVADVAAAIDYYDQVMSMADDGQQNDANFVAAVSKGVLDQMPAPAPQSLPLYKDPLGATRDATMGKRANASTMLNVRTPNYFQLYDQPFNMPQPADVAGLLSRFDELANRMTGVKFGRTGGDISSLENLAIRAGQAPSPDKPLGFKATSGLSQRMYDDVVNKGYIPQYDAAGQIVATINPETGQYGVGSVEGRIDFTNENTALERRRLQEAGVRTPSMPVFDDDSPSMMGEVANTGAGVAQPVTQDISMIPVGQIAAGGTPMYRQTLLDIAPTQYGGLLAGTRPSDFDVMNQAFRMTGATYPEYFQDPYNLTGYSILS